MDLIAIFGTHNVPRHSEPGRKRVHLLGRSIRMAITRLHATGAHAALGMGDAQPSFITIGDTQYVLSGVMFDGWYLAESSDAHAEPGSLKSFYLLPFSQAALDYHENHLPYLEFTAPNFGREFLGDEVHDRRIYLYVLWQLVDAIKPPNQDA